MRLKQTLILNVVWAGLMWLAFAHRLISSPTAPRAIVLAVLSALVAVAFLALRGRKWALVLTIFVAIVLLVRWFPMVIVNFWMFFTGHPLYLDSPATIFVVAINSILFAIPAVVLVALFSAQWRQVGEALRARTPHA